MKKKSNAGHDDLSGGEAGHEFEISVEELKTLMQRRGDESIQKLNETYGGLSGLERKLKTNLITGEIKLKMILISFQLIYFLFKVYLVMKTIYQDGEMHLVVMKFHQNHEKHSFVLCLMLYKMLDLLQFSYLLRFYLHYHFILQVE
jgi:hypothetical protein